MFHPWRVLFPSDGKLTFLLRKRIGTRLVEGALPSVACAASWALRAKGVA